MNKFQEVYGRNKDEVKQANAALAEQGALLKAMTVTTELSLKLGQLNANKVAAYNGFIREGGPFETVVEFTKRIAETEAELAIAKDLHNEIFGVAAE